MIATRIPSKPTNQNANILIDYINDQACVKVILSASPRTHSNDDHGPQNNFPLVSAVATYEVPHVGTVVIVMDQTFLVVTREIRYQEAKLVFDAAQKSGKVFYNPAEVPFTSKLTPEKAAETMLSQGTLVEFTALTRPDFYKLLSFLPEVV